MQVNLLAFLHLCQLHYFFRGNGLVWLIIGLDQIDLCAYRFHAIDPFHAPAHVYRVHGTRGTRLEPGYYHLGLIFGQEG